jgi:hypothetical protein
LREVVGKMQRLGYDEVDENDIMNEIFGLIALC